MPSEGYIRCAFISPETQVECEVWFRPSEGAMNDAGLGFCPIHKDCISLHNSHLIPDTKSLFIQTTNQERVICSRMTLPELDQHIAGLEKQIEELKTKQVAARAIRADKLEGLSDEERQKRRRMKFSDTALASGMREARKATRKSDSVKKADLTTPEYYMKKFNMTEAQAKAFLADL